MTQITAGQTLITSGTLNAPLYLVVDAGGALKTENGATNNYEIRVHGSASGGAAGGYAGVLANGTVINGAAGDIAVFGGGGYGTNPAGAGGTLAIDGRLLNQGVIEAVQLGYGGGAAQISIAATGTLLNADAILLSGADGSKNVPLATIGGSTLEVTGVLLNGGTVSVGGGKLALGYSGTGARLLIDGATGTDGFINVGTLAIHGAYPGETIGFTYAGAGGAVMVSAGRLANDGQITIGAATNSGALYGGAGGMLAIVGSASASNAGTITVDGQSTGVGITAPGGTLSIGGQSFYNSGTIDVRGAGVAGGEGGVLNVSGAFTLDGEVYIQTGSNGGFGGVANFGGKTVIGAGAAGTLALGGYKYGGTPPYYGRATVTGEMLLFPSGTIDLQKYFTGFTIAAGGELFDAGGHIDSGDVFFGSITNDGYFGSFGADDDVLTSIVNNGHVVVNGGYLGFYNALGGTGTFSILDGGTLSLNETAGSTVQFAATPGPTDTLIMTDLPAFGDTLAGINDSSVLAIPAIDVSDISTSGDLLFLGNKYETYTVHLAAPLPAGTQFTETAGPIPLTTYVGFILPGGAVPDGRGHAGGAANPSSLFAGHLTA